ncbi:hypothetical protein DPMN_129302 [Dreissena polymorpha]|uniref:Uncharacterized protein n=1 Tax=Dreissena polymorpha TaxID=45954 RepID=A0A9D4H5H8_DREPO|nr:hypothetical protein DPMN_129302 [Dreissena polymorpha]
MFSNILLIEIYKSVKLLKNKFDSLDKAVKNLENKNKYLNNKNEELTEQFSSLKEKLNPLEFKLTESSKIHEKLDQDVQKQNLEVFDLEADGNEIQTQTEAKLLDVFYRQLGVRNENSFDFAYRFSNTSATRQVLIRCANMMVRDRISAKFRSKRKAGDLPGNVMKSKSKLYDFFKKCIL